MSIEMLKFDPMNIDSRKNAFIEKFSRIQDEGTLSKFEELLQIESTHFKPLTPEEYKNEVQEGLEDYKTGRVTEQGDFEKEIESW